MGSAVPGARGVILAGVHRWGESSFERILPRPLIPVADSPVISFALRWLRDASVSSSTICANSESRLMRRLLGDGRHLGLDLNYYEDMTPRGPAGCVRDAGQEWSADDLIVVEGSVIPSLDLNDILNAHRQSGAGLTVVVEQAAAKRVDTAVGLRPVGIYLLARRVLDLIPETGYQDIKEGLIPLLYRADEPILPYRTDAPCPRITNVDTYLAANEWAIHQIVADEASNAWGPRRGNTRIHATAEVAADARFIGPVLIGPGARIGAATTIVGPTVVGRGCEVGSDVLICRSALWDQCKVGAGATVDHCILPFGATVKPNTGIMNRLCTPGPITTYGSESVADREARPGDIKHAKHDGRDSRSARYPRTKLPILDAVARWMSVGDAR